MWILAAIITVALGAEAGSGDIARARAFALKKNRPEACATLRRALSANASAPARRQLREALRQIARVPFTDKGQRRFQSGQAILFENPEAAIKLLREALELEDGNVSIRVALGSALILKNQADLARREFAAALALDPYAADAALLDGRALLDLHQFEGIKDRMRMLTDLDRWQEAYLLYLQARDFADHGQNQRAVDALNTVVRAFPHFPEPHYYLARLDRTLAAGAHWRRYVGLCRSITARERRTFGLEPRVCANQKEAEDELAKINVDS